MFNFCKNFKKSVVTAIFVMLFFLLAYSNLSAQKILGKVYESSTHMPVSDGIILALNNENKVYDITRSDSLGSFHFDKLKLGSFKIQTYRYGYADIIAGPFSFNKNDTLIMKIELDPQPIVLNPVSITAKRMERYLANRGFYDRKKMGNGYFFTQEDIEDKIINNIGELIYCIPGMVYYPAQMGGNGFMEPKIYSVRYLADGIPANIYLDGMRVDNDYIDLIPPDQIMAVEVYKSSMYAPAQYSGGWRPGGAVLIWTKH